MFEKRALLIAAVFIAGCGSVAANQPTTAPTPAASTVTSQPTTAPTPTITSQCQAGYVYDTESTGQQVFSVTNPGSPADAEEAPGNGYQLTLTNNSSQDVTVSGFSVVLYNDGSEVGSDTETVQGVIAPGQSLTWISSGYDWNLPAATSCTLTGWTT